MAHNLRPFRDYDEHDVINLFAYSGAVADAGVVKGLVVKLEAGGSWGPGTQTNSTPVDWADSVGSVVGGTVSYRYAVPGKVSAAASGEATLGLTLLDVREVDENGEKLVFNPRKAIEMGAVVSGQAIPVLTKGVVLYSGTAATAGHVAYVGASAGELASASQMPAGNTKKVGTWLSTHVNNVALLKIEL